MRRAKSKGIKNLASVLLILSHEGTILIFEIDHVIFFPSFDQYLTTWFLFESKVQFRITRFCSKLRLTPLLHQSTQARLNRRDSTPAHFGLETRNKRHRRVCLSRFVPCEARNQHRPCVFLCGQHRFTKTVTGMLLISRLTRFPRVKENLSEVTFEPVRVSRSRGTFIVHLWVPEMRGGKPPLRPPVVALHRIFVGSVHMDSTVGRTNLQCLFSSNKVTSAQNISIWPLHYVWVQIWCRGMCGVRWEEGMRDVRMCVGGVHQENGARKNSPPYISLMASLAIFFIGVTLRK